MTAISPRAVVVTPFFPSSSSSFSSSSSSSSVRVARSDGRRCGAGTSPVVRGALIARPRQSLVHRRQDDGSRGNLTLMRAEPTTTTNTLNEVLLQGASEVCSLARSPSCVPIVLHSSTPSSMMSSSSSSWFPVRCAMFWQKVKKSPLLPLFFSFFPTLIIPRSSSRTQVARYSCRCFSPLRRLCIGVHPRRRRRRRRPRRMVKAAARVVLPAGSGR